MLKDDIVRVFVATKYIRQVPSYLKGSFDYPDAGTNNKGEYEYDSLSIYLNYKASGLYFD